MTIEITPVKSSNVAGVGYDEDTNELHVVFKGGGYYIYTGPSKSIHSEMMAADSIGGFLNERIKDKFKYRKVT
jgi:hypothetical protein